MAKGPERELQTAVVRTAQLAGWYLQHQRPAIDRSGKWSTPIEGNKGYPDLTLVRKERLLFVELKSDVNYLSPSQKEWRDLLEAVEGVEYYVLRPKDWRSGLIEHLLLKGPVRNGPRH